MKKRILILCLSVTAVVLECLPYGAVLNFGIPDNSSGHAYFRETYSYFDSMTFGYGNFGPLLTAIMTCVLIILSIIYLFLGKDGLKKAVSVVSGIALVFSLMPLMFGIRFFSVVGGVISAVLAVIFTVSLIKKTVKV